jgi:hypothetical protein
MKRGILPLGSPWRRSLLKIPLAGSRTVVTCLLKQAASSSLTQLSEDRCRIAEMIKSSL